MTTALLKFGAGGLGSPCSVLIDGHELSSITVSAEVTMQAGGIPRIRLEAFVTDCTVEVTGEVKINHVTVPDSLAEDIYRTLKERFEP